MLPWRGDTLEGYPVSPEPSAYGTWVSEIMLQQTRVETVIAYWFKWMDALPTISHLANASADDVNSLWSGLGYYSRAQRLREGAQMIMKTYNGIIPDSVKQLLEIPGVGPYTAGAISSIAFDKCEPIVDGNVIRVLTRLRAIKYEINPAVEKSLWVLAKHLVDPVSPSSFNQGLMELGATVCKPVNPSCGSCPLNSICKAKEIVQRRKEIEVDLKEVQLVDIEDLLAQLPSDIKYFPNKTLKKKPRNVVLSVLVLSVNNRPEPSFLFLKRPSKGLLANQWEFPSIILAEDAKKGNTELVNVEEKFTIDKLWENFPKFIEDVMDCKWCEKRPLRPSGDTRLLVPLGFPYKLNDCVVHIFSHEKHTMHVTVKVIELDESIPNSWISPCNTREIRVMTLSEIEKEGLTTGMKRVLAAARLELSQQSNGKLVKKRNINELSSSENKGSVKEKKAKKGTNDLSLAKNNILKYFSSSVVVVEDKNSSSSS